MKSFIFILGIVFIVSGCSSVKTTYEKDPSFGTSVTQVLDAMITIPPQEEVAGSIYFEFDDTILRQASQQQLDQLAHKIRKTTGPVVVEGHTDFINNDAYNLRLGYRRALAVAQYLRDAGVWDERLFVRSFGETRPADSNHHATGQTLNRRVDIRLMAQGESFSSLETVKAYEAMVKEECDTNQSEMIGILLDPNQASSKKK